MNLEEINLILNLLNEGHNDNATAILNAERDRLLQLRKQHNQILVQQEFEKYISEILMFNGSKWSNLYSYVDGLFTFSNGISIYRLWKHLQIPEELKEKYRYDSKNIHILREAKIKEIDTIKNQCEKLLGNNKLLVDFSHKSTEWQTTTYGSGPIQHSFDMKQTNFMDTFLGPNVEVYISDKNPIAYGESDKGTGFILGRKR